MKNGARRDWRVWAVNIFIGAVLLTAIVQMGGWEDFRAGTFGILFATALMSITLSVYALITRLSVERTRVETAADALLYRGLVFHSDFPIGIAR